jgi:hypothetical protein
MSSSRVAYLLAACVFSASILASAQQSTLTSVPPPMVKQDPQAVSLIQQSLAAMTKGVPVTDATLSGSATRIAGSDQESGEVVLQAKGTQESKVALTLSNSVYTEVRNFQGGAPEGSYAGLDGVVYPLAQHNCFTGAAWFLPPLSTLGSAIGNTGADLSYIGQEALDGVAVQHLRVWLSISSPDAAAVQAIAHLSSTDIYLDSTTDLPVAMAFTTHPADNSSIDIAVEIRFSNYQQVSGILLPLHIQKFLNGSLNIDLTISSVTINSGLPDSNFSM